MENNVFIPSAELYRMVIERVAEDYNSPYKQLMRKANDIDVDFFEDIRRDSEVMSKELNMDLKEKVVEEFRKKADELFIDSGLDKVLAEKILSKASVVANEIGTTACANYLISLFTELRRYANSIVLEDDDPKFTNAELKEMYDDANTITWKERIMRNNKEDVIKFYHALMDRTWWECRGLVVMRTREFILHLADEICEMKKVDTQENANGRYVPQPVNTSDIELPIELKGLIERMAENVHEVWAEERIRQGWTYGEHRNDELKTHPCLIPYEELPESEKEYDRNTSIDTLKLIMKLGFKIEKQ